MWSLVNKAVSAVLLPQLVQSGNQFVQTVAKMSASAATYETLSVSTPKEFVYHVELNRPDKLNAMNHTMWIEIGKCFESLDQDENCRVIILSAAGKVFSAGLDFQDMLKNAPNLAAQEDVARKAKVVKNWIKPYQNSMTSLELCKKPILTAIHSACVGGAVAMITAADVRYCTKDAWFTVKEVDLGMAADVGTLQRLPKIIGSDSLVRELCYTARKMPASEALSAGLVSRVFDDKESMLAGTLEIAELISKKSPVAVQGTKMNLVYSRDHSVQDGLDQIVLWNQAMFQSEDFTTATTAQMTKQKNVVFAKL